ncbi:MAG: hypothetical protein MJB14_09355 [Spirochaetes bacterium]|nr:hypothetical protein [Spirochaetota bacterium]
MPYLSDTDILIGLEKEIAIAKENNSIPSYGKFEESLNEMHLKFEDFIRQTTKAEIDWHADVAQSKDVIYKAIQSYIKWREMIVDMIPGTDLLDWEKTNSRPDDIKQVLESIIAVLKNCGEQFDFYEIALEELTNISGEIDTELCEDRERYRIYRNLVTEKNLAREESMALFHRFRRFVKRDKGIKSVEYGQLRDRAVRQERIEIEEQPLLPLE